MARFDVHRAVGGPGYLLDVQADVLRHLTTRVVVPLLPLDMAPSPAKRLNLTFTIRGGSYMMTTQFMATVPLRELGEVVASLESHHFEIVQALDFLFGGY